MVNESDVPVDSAHDALEYYLKDLADSHPLAAEEEVLRLYFGLEGQEWTLEAIARKFGVTRERVRQIKEKALRKLRHPTRGRKLIQYAEAV